MTRNPEEIEQILQVLLDRVLIERKSIDSVLAQYPDLESELRPHLQAALWLVDQKRALEPRPGFVRASRRRLVDQIHQEQVMAGVHPGPPARPWAWFARLFASPSPAFKLVGILLVAILLVSATSGVALASQNALPGDPLYPVKLQVEEVALALTPSNAGDAQLHIEFAGRRLSEIQGLVQAGRYDPIPGTVNQFESDVSEALDAVERIAIQDEAEGKTLAASLQSGLQEEASGLQPLTSQAPASTRAQLARALNVYQEANQAAQALITDEEDPQTLSPTSTPFPSPTSAAAPTATATARPSNTSAPTPTASQVASSGDDRLDPTFTPTKTNQPSRTPKPTRTPRPTQTPEPTGRPPATDQPPTQPPPPPTEPPEPTQPPAPTSAPPPTQVPQPTQEPPPTQDTRPTTEPVPTSDGTSGINIQASITPEPNE